MDLVKETQCFGGWLYCLHHGKLRNVYCWVHGIVREEHPSATSCFLDRNVRLFQCASLVNNARYELSGVIPFVLVCEGRSFDFHSGAKIEMTLTFFFFHKIFKHVRLSGLMLCWRVSYVRLGERVGCSSDCNRNCTVTLSRLRYVCARKDCKSDVRLTVHRNSVWIRKTN